MIVKNHLVGRNLARTIVLACVPLQWSPGLMATDGHFLHGAGPVNEAMGGADTAICLDATGSIAWNPACTTRFMGKRLEFHATAFIPWRDLSSTVSAGAFGPGFPANTMQGTTVSHWNASLMPGLAFIYHAPSSRNASHFALLAVSGFGVNYAQNTNVSNPILTAQPPKNPVPTAYAFLNTPAPAIVQHHLQESARPARRDTGSVGVMVEAIETVDGVHHVRLLQKPTYVDFDKCIGCRHSRSRG